MKIFIYSTYPFLLQSTLLPTQPPFNQSNFFGKVKSSIRVQIFLVFFQYARSSLTKQKKCFLEASYGVNQTSKLQAFTKKVNGLQPTTISGKKIHLRSLKGSSRIPALTLMNPTSNINTSTKSKDLMQKTRPLFNNSPTSPYN